MIKNLKILTWFIYDLLKVRKNDLHINKNSSYQVMRTLYRISNGLITNLIGYFLSGLKYKNSNKFKNGYLELEKISKDEVQSLKKEISKMRDLIRGKLTTIII